MTRAGSAYGRSELMTALDQYTAGERSPARFREFAVEIARIDSRFDDEVSADAERHLVFLASSLLEQRFDQPLDAQLDELAVTVWPTLLGIEPTAGETSAAFARRICGGDLGLTCKHVVPEKRALMLTATVWRELEDRARDAVSECRTCRDDQSYTEAIARIDEREKDITARATLAEDSAHPKSWPTAGDHASPWSGAPLLAVSGNGKLTIGDQEVAPGGLPRALRALAEAPEATPTSRVLGVYLLPGARVSDLRAIIRDAGAVGYSEIALQVRAADYPYPVREYRLAAAGGKPSPRIRVRDTDSIQVLIQALDVTASNGTTSPLRI